MLPLLAIALYLATPLIMLVIQWLRPRFAFHWLAASVAALLALPMLALARPAQPTLVAMLPWQEDGFFAASPFLLLDPISWSFALADAALLLAALLTFVARRQEPNWRAWAGGLLLTGIGVIAALAGNLLTMLLAWAALDLVEFLIFLSQLSASAARERAVAALSARMSGLVLALGSWLWARSAGEAQDFSAPGPLLGLLLLLAAALRLGVLPLHLPFPRETPLLRRGLGALARLIPLSASLMLVCRVAESGILPAWQPAFLALVAFAALYGGWMWLLASNEILGRPYWLIASASLAVGAAARGLPDAALAWGLAALLPGGALFLYSARHRLFLPLLAAGWLGISGLPYTPAWPGVASSFPWMLPALALLLLGYAHHALRAEEAPPAAERWAWILYAVGLAAPVAVYVWILWPPGFAPPAANDWAGWLGGAAAVLLAGAMGLLGRRGIASRAALRLWRPGGGLPGRLASLDWLYRGFWSLYRLLGRGLAAVTLALEGEGGVLWALVLLALLASLFIAPGGVGR